MKTIFVFGVVLLAALATNVASYPAFGEGAVEAFAEDGTGTQSHGDAAFEEAVEEHGVGVRMKRATCDLLSFQSMWVTPNHSACAAHCLALFKGYKGGRCIDAVCHCRK